MRSVVGLDWGGNRPSPKRALHVDSIEEIDDQDLPLYEPDPEGGYRLQGLKPAGAMTEAEKIRFVSRHGIGAWTELVRESHRQSAERPVGPFKNGEESSRFIEEHGLAEWKKRMAEHRRQ